MAGDAHQPAQPLRYEVEPAALCVWPRRPEPRDRAVHDRRIYLSHLLVAQSEPLERARPEVLDEDVRLLRHSLRELASTIGSEIHHDAAFVAVDAEKCGRLPFDERRTHTARIVTAVGFFDFDDVRAHVAEHHGAVRPRHNLGQIENLHSVEGQ